MTLDLHPALVHFPIAWILLGAGWAVADALRPDRPISGATDLLLLLGCGSALAAAVTGESALAGYDLAGAAREAAEAHETAGGGVAWLAGGALALRFAHRLQIRRAGGPARAGAGAPGGEVPRAHGAAWAWGTAAIATVAAGLALYAGHLGGRLVHEHGVTPVTAPRAPDAPPRGPDVYRSSGG